MSERRLSSVSMALAAVVLCGTTVSGTTARADEVDDAAEDLARISYFVRQDRQCWDQLLAEYGRAIDDLAQRPGADLGRLHVGRDELRVDYADVLAEDVESHEKSITLYRSVAENDIEGGAQDRARNAWSTLHLRRGESAPDVPTKLLEFESALVALPTSDVAFESWSGVQITQSNEDYKNGLFAKAMGGIDQMLQHSAVDRHRESDPVREATDLRKTIDDATGPVSVRLLGRLDSLRRRGGDTDFQEWRVELMANDRPSVTLTPGADLALAGDYQAVVTGTGGSARVVVEDFTLSSDGTAIPAPAIIPQDMVWVRDPSRGISLLCDRFEVSNEQFQEYLTTQGRTHAYLAGPDRATNAAAGVSFDDAKGFARWSGKRLPTLEEWRVAVWGPERGSRSEPPRTDEYPWGESGATVSPNGDGQIVGKRAPTDGPLPIDSCASGATADFGLCNAVGNVMEWTSEGWLIGAGWTMRRLHVKPTTQDPAIPRWDANLAWDALPFQDVYDSWKDSTAELHKAAVLKFENYHYATDEASEKTRGRQYGIRCVITLE